MTDQELQFQEFIDNDGKLADLIPIRGLQALIEENPEYENLILEEAKVAPVYAILSSLVTQDKNYFKSPLHAKLSTSLIANLTEQEKVELATYIS